MGILEDYNKSLEEEQKQSGRSQFVYDTLRATGKNIVAFLEKSRGKLSDIQPNQINYRKEDAPFLEYMDEKGFKINQIDAALKRLKSLNE